MNITITMGGEEKLVINESDLRGVPRLKVRKPQQPEKSTLSSSAQQNKVPLKKPIVLSRPDGSKPLAAKPAQPLEEKVAEVTLPGIPVGSDAYTEGMKYVRDCLDYVTQSMELREKGNTTKADGRYKIAEEKSQKADALLRQAEFDKRLGRGKVVSVSSPSDINAAYSNVIKQARNVL